jgi:hypothetical protein
VSCVAVLLPGAGSVEVALTVDVTTIEDPPGLGGCQISVIGGAAPTARLVRVQVRIADGAGQQQRSTNHRESRDTGSFWGRVRQRRPASPGCDS